MQVFRNFFPAVALAVLAATFSSGLRAEDTPRAKKPPVDAEKLLSDAAKAEADGKYEEALQQYLKAFTAGRTDPDTRDRIRNCFRHVTQAERHRDPAFQKFLAGMQASDAITLYGEVVEKIHKTYTDRTKATVERLFAAGLDELEAALNEPAFRNEHLKDVSDSKVADFRSQIRENWQNKLPTTPQDAKQAARAIITAAQKTLGLKNGTVVAFELLCGACTGLDEYSSYAPPGGEQAAPMAELAAYGLRLQVDAKGLLVEAVLPFSWAAAHTKLRKGDRIEKVNGKSVAGASPAAVADALRAADASGHVIELTPAEDAARSYRLPTPLPTVYAADIVEMKEGVGYLRLAAFKDRTAQEFDDAILELKARGLKALVIDLRGNPGGLFASAVEIAKRLLPNGPIATTTGQVPDFINRVFSSNSGMAAHDFPVVLLVDTKTMSAAEILAASLKDNERATLIGLPTFGKGLIQAGIRLQSLDTGDDRGVKSGVLILSVASASGPLSGLIHGRGVTPHIAEANPDRQLTLAVEKAIELLTGMRDMPPMPPESSLPPMPPLVRR